jgi:hypothetical protein
MPGAPQRPPPRAPEGLRARGKLVRRAPVAGAQAGLAVPDHRLRPAPVLWRHRGSWSRLACRPPRCSAASACACRSWVHAATASRSWAAAHRPARPVPTLQHAFLAAERERLDHRGDKRRLGRHPLERPCGLGSSRLMPLPPQSERVDGTAAHARSGHASERVGCPLVASLCRCRSSSDSAASGCAKRCARTAPLPRSRRLPLRSWSSS